VNALADQNAQNLIDLNISLSDDIADIQAVIDELGIEVGDTDYDGLSDLNELTYATNPLKMDTDCDNLNDAFEIKYGTDPNDDDSDDDGYYDGIEIASNTDPLDAADYPGVKPPSEGVAAIPSYDLLLIVGVVMASILMIIRISRKNFSNS